MKKYVIIGNSTAAIAAIEGIRSQDTTGSITLISDENHFTYGRPLISYYLYRNMPIEKLKYRPESFYDDNQVSTILGIKAVKIDSKKKLVFLENGSTVDYDKLLVATGSRPFVPPMQGLEKVEKQYSFMKLDDALAIEKDFKKEDNILIIGAGLIGLKCLEGIYDRVASVSVVDMANRVLPSIIDEEGSTIIQKQLEDKGVKFYLSDSAACFEKNSVALKSGKKLSFDKLVLAVGVRANIELVKEAGGDCDRGICANNKQETSLKDVYAAGDCCDSYDISAKMSRILALLPNAYYQGNTAGLNMTGKENCFTQAIPMNSMGLFGTHMMTAGVYEGEVYEEKTQSTYKKLFYKDNLLKGFILIGCIERAGIYTSLLRNQTPLDSIDFSLIEKSPALMAFSKSVRKEKLTRKV